MIHYRHPNWNVTSCGRRRVTFTEVRQWVTCKACKRFALIGEE